MPPTAELLRQLKPPPEIKLITQFCDDVLRRRRPQRLTLVKPMPLQSLRSGKPPLLLTGSWGPIPEEEVSVWPTLFHAQDIEVADVETFLTWLKRMQTRESGWLFAYPEMTFPPRPMAPFLASEASAGDYRLQATGLRYNEQTRMMAHPPPLIGQPGAMPGLPAITRGYVPVRGVTEIGGAPAPAFARRPGMTWPFSDDQLPGQPVGVSGYVPTRGDRIFSGKMRALVPARGEGMLAGLPDAYVPTQRPLLTGKGFVPTSEQADGMRRTMAARRLRAIEAEAAPPSGKITAPPTGAARGGIAPRAMIGVAVPILAGAATARLQARPPFMPITAAGGSGAPFSPETPSFAWPRSSQLPDGTTYARTPSSFGGSIPIPYPQFPQAGLIPGGQPRAAWPASPMMTGKVTWQSPTGREWTSFMRVPMPLAGYAPIPFPQFNAVDFNGMPAPGRQLASPMLAQGVTGQMTMGAGANWTTYARTPSSFGGSIPIPYPHIPVNAAGFMAAGLQRAGELPGPLAPGTLLENPYIGQMTLIAPPLRVASEEAEDSGTAVAFNWDTLTRGQGPLDARGLSALRRALPADAQLIYPALPKGQLPAGAVNLRLAQPTVAHLLEAGYGFPSGAGVAARAVSGTEAAIGASPQAMPLAGHIVPGKRPAGSKESLLPSRAEQPGGELPGVGVRQAKRGGALDFLGLPISLAPSLGGRSDVREAVSSNVASGKIAGIIRPNVFGPLRQALFPSFHSIEAEPDRQAWEKAAPSFGLRDSKPLTVLAPQARAPIITPSSSLPQIGGELPPVPGSLPQMHVAEAAPVLHAMPSPGGMHSGLHPTTTTMSPAALASVSGGAPRAFRPLSQPSSGLGATPRHHGMIGSTPTFASPHFSETAPTQCIGRPAFSPIAHLPAVTPMAGIPGGAPIPTPSPISASPAHGFMPSPAFGSPVSHPSIPRPDMHIPMVPHQASPTALPTPGPLGGLMSRPIGGPPSGPSSRSSSGSFSFPDMRPAELPSPDMHLPSPPSVTSPGSGMRASTSLVSRAPARLYTPAVPRVMTGAAPLAIQRSIEIGQVDSEVQSGGRQAEGQAATQTQREGQQGAEISLLATEVWSILKQRLATEAIRRGRW